MCSARKPHSMTAVNKTCAQPHEQENITMRLSPLSLGLIMAGLLPLPAKAQIRADIRTETRPSIVAQVTETVEKVGRKVVGLPEIMELENAERPLVLLQVFENRRIVYAKPDNNSKAIGEFFKGQLVDAFEEKMVGTVYAFRTAC